MKKEYICNCVNYQELFDNATLMAQTVENSQKISKKEFYENVVTTLFKKKLKQVEYRKNKNLFILHDIIEDIHYFYV